MFSAAFSRRAVNVLILGLIAICSTQQARAERWSNQFVEFELPPQWQCSLEGAEWICQSKNPLAKTEAMMVLAAKLKGPQDSIEKFQAYLEAPKTFTNAQGKPMKSELKTAKRANYNNQEWVDALHFESELPGYYTRYWATVVKEDLAVLITYAVTKDKYQSHIAQMDSIVSTLRAFYKGGGINVQPASASLFSGSQAGAGAGDSGFSTTPPPAAPTDDAASEQARPRSKKSPMDDEMLMYGAIAAAVIGFLIWKRRRSQNSNDEE